ncbi:CBU_0592 family membrane protein [Pseudomonas aeruginosa]
MIEAELLYELIGYLGSTLIAAAFLGACLGLTKRRPRWFLVVNLVGAAALCFPAYQSGTTAALAINGFWILVALSGLVAAWRRGISPSPLNIALYAYSAAAIAMLFADWIIHRNLSIPALGGIVAMVLFMTGYWGLARHLNSTRALDTYLWTALAGNLLYIPLLVLDGNLPILALQIVCTAIAIGRLSHIHASRYRLRQSAHNGA